MLTADPVLLLSEIVSLLLVPTVTLPKASLVGLSASRPLATPVPVSETVAELLDALLVIETVALKPPGALGEKTTVSGVLWPASIAVGRLGALNEKYWVENDALLTVTEAVPVFDAVSVTVLVVPTVTEPKSKLAPFRDNVPD